MLTDLFWDVATSTTALSVDAVILLAALAVGFLPLVKYLPVIGPYVPVAKLVAFLVAALLFFMTGFRAADERAEAKDLRAKVAAQQMDLQAAQKAASDETTRANSIEASANEQHQRDEEYISSLKARPACALDSTDIGGVRDGRSGAR